MRHNTKVSMLCISMVTIGISIISRDTVMSPYIYYLTNDIKTVGYISSVSGLTMFLSALPIGYAVDKYDTKFISKITCLCGIISSAFMFMALFYDNVHLLYLAYSLFGISSTMNITLVNSILDYSVDAVEYSVDAVEYSVDAVEYSQTYGKTRTQIYARQFAILYMSEAIGPLFAMIVFSQTGNDWSIYMLRSVLYVGNAIYMSSFIPILLFRHNDTVELSKDNDTVELSKQVMCVPYIIASSDLITAIASGLVMEYFSLYLILEYEMDPIYVALILMSGNVSVAIVSYIGSNLIDNNPIKLMYFAIALDAVGTIFMGLLIWKGPLSYVICVYIVYTACINSATPFQRSIIVDIIPKKQRGKWNSIEHVNNFAWYASSIAGGWIINVYEFNVAFAVTCGIYIIGVIVLIIARLFLI